jgi:hypothetical protein
MPGDAACCVGDVLGVEPGARLGIELAVHACHRVDVESAGLLQAGTRKLGLEVGDQQPKRGQHPWSRRHDDGRHAEQARQCAPVQRSGAAEGQQ